ncbi:hypothetical protein [Bacillus paramycoides]|nr:hypothetical protein [Bacillus paramycoides]
MSGMLINRNGLGKKSTEAINKRPPANEDHSERKLYRLIENTSLCR